MLGYRMFARVQGESDQMIRDCREQFHAWLRWKRLDADAVEPGRRTRVGDNAVVTLLEKCEADGSTSIHGRLVDDQPTGRWTVEMTAHVPGRVDRSPWLLIETDAPSVDTPGDSLPARMRWADAPKIVGFLLDVVPAFDGSARLSPTVAFVGLDSVEHVLEVACDPVRRGLVFVAGTAPCDDVEAWRQRVQTLVDRTVGVATAYVLSPEATAAFNEGIGNSHRVMPGALRSFKPDADPAVEVDARRHRVLSASRIARDDPRALAKILGWNARETVIEPALPKDAARVIRSFEADIDDLATAGSFLIVSPSAESVDSVPVPTQRSAPAVETLPDVRHEIRELRAQLDEMRGLADLLRERLEDAQLNEAVAEESRHKAEETVLRLQKVLTVAGREDEAYLEPVAEPSANYDDLLSRIETLEFVCFSGPREPLEELAENDPFATRAAKAWEVAQVLDDYARAVRENGPRGGVHTYLTNTPGGFRGHSPKNHAPTESDDVQNNPKFWQQRVFPVPVDVDPSGEITMFAHFKLAKSKMISPRLHYLDLTARTGKVYIGYIGRLLDTRQTN